MSVLNSKSITTNQRQKMEPLGSSTQSFSLWYSQFLTNLAMQDSGAAQVGKDVKYNDPIYFICPDNEIPAGKKVEYFKCRWEYESAQLSFVALLNEPGVSTETHGKTRVCSCIIRW